MLSRVKDQYGYIKTLTLEQYEVDFEKHTIERVNEIKLLNKEGEDFNQSFETSWNWRSGWMAVNDDVAIIQCHERSYVYSLDSGITKAEFYIG